MNIDQILLDISKSNPLGIGGKISKNAEVKKFLEENYESQTNSNTERLYLYINGMKCTPKCKYCNVNLVKFRSFSEGYLGACHDRKCSPDRNEHLKNIRKVVDERSEEVNNIELIDFFDRDYILNFVNSNMMKKNGDLNGNYSLPAHFIKKFGVEEYKKIFSYFLKNKDNFSGGFAHFIYDLENGRKKCHCGNHTNFVNRKRGYLEFCSTKCANNDESKVEAVRVKLLSYEAKERNRTQKIKFREDRAKLLEQEGYKVLGIHGDYYDMQCKKCNFTFTSTYGYRRCYKCNPVKYKKEFEIAEHLPGAKVNLRGILSNKRIQLDCYLEEKKLAVEFDGLLFHSYGISESNKLNNINSEDRHAHLNKTKMCEEQGIRLLRVWSNEWDDETLSSIWVSKFNHELGKSEKIYARNCKMKEVSSKEARQFLVENHLQGSCQSTYQQGLYYKDELVSLMAVGKSRFNKKYDWELLRMCNKKGVVVVGGFSKLLSHFKKSLSGKMISYANRRWSSGGVYEKIGFDLVGETPPNYFYVDKTASKVFNRIQFQKHKLKEVLENFDESLSERENMLNHGYRILWDCGSLIYETSLG